MPVKGRCENKCLKDVYTVEETEERLDEVAKETEGNVEGKFAILLGNKQNKVLYGTSKPSSSLGSNGDVYLKIE